ncbi:MAG: hypothetical protein A2Z42_02505 [Candidatus Woykebacteria bacterium RBG_19FT_COMBO_43_10]|uniref:Uncharacterized protein n=1 Tax=Candidatus Woykebacteria bacterium RBG_19FT_COMBO_43_10 TaxID=1802598 RepID=A0A1G1WLJ1_9BACT|nr:MAG: hypothetical protein A2Z42_02505 [Candidatus Woykebacteria bacterium RBG_19FT_COMBO_43_10]
MVAQAPAPPYFIGSSAYGKCSWSACIEGRTETGDQAADQVVIVAPAKAMGFTEVIAFHENLV